MKQNYFRYRIYTEDKDSTVLENILNEYFEGYTIYKTTGYWKTVKEPSVVVEIITETDQEKQILTLVKVIKKELRQEAVLYTEELITGGLV